MAHAHFDGRIFLSLLAGKLATFEQMLLTEQMGKNQSMRTSSARILIFKFFGGKSFHLKQPITSINSTKNPSNKFLVIDFLPLES